SSDNLIYYCNLKLMNAGDIKNDLKNIKSWMLGQQTKNIGYSIKQIIPENKITTIKKYPLLNQFLQIPSEHIKNVFFTIIVGITLIVKPEWLEKLITEFLK
ncbi:unnamed protein product, partial [marine sediment metagenome]